ncbi:MAG: GGDEF domain-containing protein [Lachnospiraceae bacterium]|nr:GGDEF domain-containing protein [Lachnospiraceae bacterium]
MNQSYQIIVNFVAIAGMLLVLAATLQNGLLPPNTRRRFMYLVLVEFVDLLCYNAELYFSALDHLTLWRVMFSAVGYSIRPLAVAQTMLIVTEGRMHKFALIATDILLTVNVAVAFSAFFTDVAYYYVAPNTFCRGPLGLLPYGVAVILIAMVFAHALKDFREEKEEILMVLLAILMSLGGMIIESISEYPGGSRPAFALGFVFIYLHCQVKEEKKHLKKLNRKVRIDPLTGVLNRGAYMDDMEELTKEKDSSIGVIYCDVNGLKTANDTIGHAAGDLLLKKAVRVLNSHAPGDYVRIYRLGGDEFVAVCTHIGENEFYVHIDQLKEELKNDWVFCCGGAWFASLEDVDKATRIAEKSMYRNKADYYRAHPEQDRRLQRQAKEAAEAENISFKD